MIRVFLYLAWRSTYNRVARQARQLKNPRYLAALAFGLTYLWIVAVDQRPEHPPQVLVGARWLELVGDFNVRGTVKTVITVVREQGGYALPGYLRDQLFSTLREPSAPTL